MKAKLFDVSIYIMDVDVTSVTIEVSTVRNIFDQCGEMSGGEYMKNSVLLLYILYLQVIEISSN